MAESTNIDLSEIINFTTELLRTYIMLALCVCVIEMCTFPGLK